MKAYRQGSVYAVTLTDREWYGAGETAQERITKQSDICLEAKAEAEKLGCQYVSVMVEPDGVLTISPIDIRHQVWRHSFEPASERHFKAKLVTLIAEYNDIPWKRMAAILKSYSEG